MNKIYHYTDAVGLFNILDKKDNTTNSLWATHCSFMNDKEELQYCKNLIVKRINIFRKKNLQFEEELKKLEQWVVNQWDAHHHYILSFSIHHDSLSLWNRYGKNDGYNIEFDQEKLFEHLKNSKPKLFGAFPVIYNPEKQNEIIDNIIERFANEQSKNHNIIDNEKTAELKFQLWPFLFNMKDKCFHDEYEFRYIFNLTKSTKMIQSDEFNENSKFRVKNGIIVPYLEIPLDDKLKVINKIHIGPLNNSDNVIQGLKLFIEKHRYNIEIDVSKIPYRTV